MEHFPIFLDLKGRLVLVAGGGAAAARKASLLVRAGARLRVVAPTLDEMFGPWLALGVAEHLMRPFVPGDLENCALAITVCEDAAANAAVSAAARARMLPVNVADRPDLCSFLMPAIVDRSPVLVAVSTGGAAPTLARLLRARLECLVPAAYGELAELARSFRTEVRHRLRDGATRRRFWAGVLTGRAADLVFAGRRQAAHAALRTALDRADLPAVGPMPGSVTLVGTGPGDPELLTLKALRLLQEADVIVHDGLVSTAVLDLARREAERISVGTAHDRSALPQDEINRLLVRLARRGRRVVRLKEAAPHLFERTRAEIAALAAAGIACETVPGIAAAANDRTSPDTASPGHAASIEMPPVPDLFLGARAR
jgi:uroporphyrin-III C-methyltransferase/precorrin-2 dehydrogenase/sirohydrochlorin ferrochelatase